MKYLFTFIVCCAMLSTSFSQEPIVKDGNELKMEKKEKKKKEKMEAKIAAKKIAYLTTELDLSEEEAQRFWPIYNDFSKEMKEIRAEDRSRPMDDVDMTDAQAEEFLQNHFNKEQKTLDLKVKYLNKMEGAISKAKVAKFLIIERKFKSRVFDSVKRKMRGDRKRKEKRKRK